MSEMDYCDMSKKIDEDFITTEAYILEDFQKNSSEYRSMRQKMSELLENNKFLFSVLEGDTEITLTANEHRVLKRFLALQTDIDMLERQRLYFRGHTDCISYLKKVGALN